MDTTNTFKYNVPDERELTLAEIQILSYLFAQEKPEWLNLIGSLKIIARCGCGKCPTIIFNNSFDSKTQNNELIIDYIGNGKNGEMIGISLFGTKEMPIELEFYSIDGLSEIISIPEINTLRPNHSF